jgi:hypothetical protein
MIQALKHTRRWLQFSLGTMFLLVTVVAVWLALTTADIRARKAMRGWITANQGMIVTGADSPAYFDPPPRAVEISVVRRWLGDEAIAYVWMPKCATNSDWSHARPLFPEALWMDEVSYDWVSIDEVRRKETGPDTEGGANRFLTILTAVEEQEAYEEAAKRAGVTVSEWARGNLNKAARKQP